MREGAHIVALIMHEHDNDVEAPIARYESELRLAGLPDIPFHGVKLLHGHDGYEGIAPETRKKLLFRFAAFVSSLPVRYAAFIHEAPAVGDAGQLDTALRRDLSRFAFDNLPYFQRFDEIHVYYDGAYPNPRKISTSSQTHAHHRRRRSARVLISPCVRARRIRRETLRSSAISA